jgi:RNA polymerase sigma factor (sigma-70 family)
MATLADEVRDRAFERMYEAYVRDVYRYVLAVLRNPADAEDVTQTTFMNAYKAFKRGERPHKPQNWLITIAHNACRSKAIRASRRPREVPLEDVVTQLSVPEQDKVSVRELLKALGRLPFNQRAAIAMRELEGRSYEEIAETLDVTVPAVEALLVRARRTLRAQHAAVRGLTVVQVPRSLRSLFEHGEATTAVAGGLVGGGVLVKAAAVLVAGVVAGGVGYTGVEAGIGKGSGDAGPRLEPRLPMVASEPAAAAPAVAARPSAASRPKRPEPAATARHMPAAPVATTGVVVAPGGATAPTAHGGVPGPVEPAAQETQRVVGEAVQGGDPVPTVPAAPALPPLAPLSPLPPLPVGQEPPALPPLPAAPVPPPAALPAVPPAPALAPTPVPAVPDLPASPKLP